MCFKTTNQHYRPTFIPLSLRAFRFLAASSLSSLRASIVAKVELLSNYPNINCEISLEETCARSASASRSVRMRTLVYSTVAVILIKPQ